MSKGDFHIELDVTPVADWIDRMRRRLFEKPDPPPYYFPSGTKFSGPQLSDIALFRGRVELIVR